MNEALRAAACPICGSESVFLFAKGRYKVDRCVNCGLGFIDPVPGAREMEEFYNSGNYYKREDAGYSDYVSLEKGHKRIYAGFIRSAGKSLGFDIRGKSVLDVGCAHGFFLDTAKEMGAEGLWGTDITMESGRLIESKGYRFSCGSFESLDLPERAFDLVFLGDVFEHLFDPFEAAARLSRILRPGGVVILTTVNFASPFVRLAGGKWRLMVPPEHIYYWTAKSLGMLFERHGFKGFCKGYWMYVEKSYLVGRFRVQFGFSPFFFKLYPFSVVPVRSFDTMLCFFRKKD